MTWKIMKNTQTAIETPFLILSNLLDINSGFKSSYASFFKSDLWIKKKIRKKVWADFHQELDLQSPSHKEFESVSTPFSPAEVRLEWLDRALPEL